MSKRPWLKFYATDWRSDPALRLCSRAARGTWIDMISIMHEAEPYGELRVNGNPMDAKSLAKLLGEPVEDIESDLAELERNGVFSRRRNGVIYSRRMERDEINASKNRDNGKMGGNPSLSKQTTKKGPVNPEVKAQIPEARSQIPEESSYELSSARETFTAAHVTEAMKLLEHPGITAFDADFLQSLLGRKTISQRQSETLNSVRVKLETMGTGPPRGQRSTTMEACDRLIDKIRDAKHAERSDQDIIDLSARRA